jgi:homoserine O-acetyltransferase
MSGSVGIVETKYVTLVHADNPLVLDSGKKLAPIQVAYETYGRLNPAGDNAILVLHALSGDAHAAGVHSAEDKKPGWWDVMIGPGRAMDTDKYFVVCSNFLGGCKGTTGPSSVDPLTGKPYGLEFPIITIGDTVEVQRRLMDHLGIKQWHSMTGGSMGGMQAMEWTVRYPGLVKSAIPIATTSRLSAQGIAFNAVGRNAITSDPCWNHGDYYEGPAPSRGLAVARMIGHITYLSEESMHQKFGRRLQKGQDYAYEMEAIDFQVEGYLEYKGQSFVERFDANTYLYITKAMDYFDLAASHGGTLKGAFDQTRAKFLVISFSSDWLFPTWQSKEIVRSMIAAGRDVSFLEIKTSAGHDAFLLEAEQITRAMKAFLENV